VCPIYIIIYVFMVARREKKIQYIRVHSHADEACIFGLGVVHIYQGAPFPENPTTSSLFITPSPPPRWRIIIIIICAAAACTTRLFILLPRPRRYILYYRYYYYTCVYCSRWYDATTFASLDIISYYYILSSGCFLPIFSLYFIFLLY